MDISLIPESAPFNAEQRAWLNGFFAGWLGLQNSTEAVPPAVTPEPLQESKTEPEPEPWHDPALAIDERLRLAEGKPIARRLMAAMAQLDCGACGYLCRTYGEAIADGVEKRLTLCSPGGAETSKTLKKLVKERIPIQPVNGVSRNGRSDAQSYNEWSRESPFTASVIRSVKLNRAGSEKETRHVEIALGADGPIYEVGDALGVYPENCPQLVEELIAALRASGDESVTRAAEKPRSLRPALLTERCLTEVTEPLLELLAASAVDPAEIAAARELINDDGPIAGADVLDIIQRFPSARPDLAAFVGALAGLRPRLYSISSSPKRHPGQVHLTVSRVAYEANGRLRKGVASTMLADRVGPNSSLRVFVQKSHGFTLPADPDTPVIMIGPGTGIAPFRAFLHERDAVGAKGKTWLFFGEQRAATDFLYEDELADFLERGVLTRLDSAFSRDQEHKIYVQDRIAQRGAELFAWLEQGASIYVCGDAKRMAADVDRALRELIAHHGGITIQSARERLAAMAAAARYRRDVY
jgi:sulfite reductase (NADPH) flavoprotein alpha-component